VSSLSVATTNQRQSIVLLQVIAMCNISRDRSGASEFSSLQTPLLLLVNAVCIRDPLGNTWTPS